MTTFWQETWRCLSILGYPAMSNQPRIVWAISVSKQPRHIRLQISAVLHHTPSAGAIYLDILISSISGLLTVLSLLADYEEGEYHRILPTRCEAGFDWVCLSLIAVGSFTLDHC